MEAPGTGGPAIPHQSTSRIRAAEALHEHTRRLRRLVRHSGDCVRTWAFQHLDCAISVCMSVTYVRQSGGVDAQACVWGWGPHRQ